MLVPVPGGDHPIRLERLGFSRAGYLQPAMARLFTITLALLLVQAGFTLPAQDRDAGWRSDIEFFVAEAQRVHADPQRPAYGDTFTAAAEKLQAQVPSLSDDQVLARMMKLAAILNDGHTGLYGPGPNSKLPFERRVLPFKFYIFPSGLYIIDGAEDWGDFAGNRVLRFGDVTAEEVMKRMSAYRGVDNAQTWAWMGPQFYLPKLALLKEVGVEVTEGTVELTLSAIEGEEESLTVEGGDYSMMRKLRPFPLRDGEPPLYLRNLDTNYWLQPMPEHQAMYLQFNQVRDAAGDPIPAFAERLRTALRENDSKLLIVDTRHNNGGNNTLLRPLVRALIEFEMRSGENRIVVLMGRNTFSACQNFLNRVERWTNATFVGEPSSSRPNFVGESNEIELPFSKVQGSISNMYWQDSDPWDQRQWIEPDVEVLLTVDDYLAGLDPILARALQM